ncbi:hypothetical protein A3A40_00115 [Candidatus Kaiserbacteria bacterium RIFCSPLOWO2_01_FULL_54_20]|uniref:OmpR/PhoB-type domain-containing protein n=1 Tax=Candidatus Kaiserbacteria bacterium RIFCSPLOWO2_01_FULL_54_20 TaxID=1798513 RepID=A0A1F6EJK6_9BACT|nr:MAG: hypothetical protein A3A40_00115 [Candidatus Kaiserbacteria bacterium RIFCSPLOWO2_01_FULL_54_20]
MLKQYQIPARCISAGRACHHHGVGLVSPRTSYDAKPQAHGARTAMTTPGLTTAAKPATRKTFTFWSGHAVFYPETKMLKVDGSRVRLAPEVTNLLLQLASGDPARTHSKRVLMDALDINLENTLRARAGKLRRALRAGSKESQTLEDPVRSEYGIGYVLAK